MTAVILTWDYGRLMKSFTLLKNASIYKVNGEDMVLSDDTGKNGLIFKQVFF
jgi:hypothetical protein